MLRHRLMPHNSPFCFLEVVLVTDAGGQGLAQLKYETELEMFDKGKLSS